MLNMIKYLVLPLSIVLRNTWIVAGLFECCPKENNIIFVSNNSCGYNKLNISDVSLNCSIKLRFSKEDWDELKFKRNPENGTVLDDDLNEMEYCHAIDGDDPSNSNTSLYILCYKQSLADEFDVNKLQAQGLLICISAAFVICTIIVYFMVPSLLDLQGICMVHALAGLSLAYISLSILQLVDWYDEYFCKIFAYLTYLSFFYMFFWLVVLSFHIWRITVIPHLSEKNINWLVLYHIFAIGGALFSLIIILLAHYSPSSFFDNIRPGFGDTSCWFESRTMTWIYFYGPIIVLLIINILFYVSTVVSLWQRVNSTRNKVLKYRVKLCLRLCVIMGITWTIEIFTFIINSDTMSKTGKIIVFILDLVNALQGILIFLILVVFRKRVRRALASKNLCNIKFPNSWRYLEDDEMESAEEKANGAILCYRKNEDVVDNEVVN